MGVLAFSLWAGPASASGTTLFKDSLKAPSSALQPESGDRFSTNFHNGHFVIFNQDFQSQIFVPPQFRATGDQLAMVSVDVDVSLTSPVAQAGVFCRRNTTSKGAYTFMIQENGAWTVYGHNNGSSTPLAHGSVRAPREKPVHLRMECRGLVQESATGKVELKGFINGKRVADVTDSNPDLLLNSGPVGVTLDGGGSALYNNLVVAQLSGSPPA